MTLANNLPFFGTVVSEKIVPSALSGRTVLGGQSTDWVIDQCQIITESPRRPAASPATPTIRMKSEYFVRLVGQIVPMVSLPNPRVSIETVKLVNSLPAEFASSSNGQGKKGREYWSSHHRRLLSLAKTREGRRLIASRAARRLNDLHA